MTTPSLQQRPGVIGSGARAGPASPAAPAAEPAPGSGDADARRGARFEEMKARERGGREPGAAAGAAGASAPAAAGAAAPPEAPAQPPAEAVKKAASFVDVVRARLGRVQSIGLGYKVKGRHSRYIYVPACTNMHITLLFFAKGPCFCASVLGSLDHLLLSAAPSSASVEGVTMPFAVLPSLLLLTLQNSRARVSSARNLKAFRSLPARQEDEEASTSGASANGAPPGADGAGDGGGGAGGAGGAFSADMLEQFFRDPEMQKLLYKYLPEPMQNPQTFEWMLSNPQYRKQLEDIMQQQARAPRAPRPPGVTPARPR